MDSQSELDEKAEAYRIQAFYRSLTEQSPLPVAVVDGSDHILYYANPALCGLLGKKDEELAGARFEEIIPEAREFLTALDQIRGADTADTGTSDLLTRRTGNKWPCVFLTVVNTADHPIRVLIHLADATEAVRFRERLVDMNQELLISALSQHEQVEAFQEASKVAQLASTAKDQFLALLSHELRTPLTPVLAAVSMLQRNASLDASTQNLLQVIRRNVEMEARLIDDLLDFTRILQGKVSLEFQPAELTEIIGYAVEVCAENIHARQIEFALDAPDGPYPVLADGTRLRQVFWNLLQNAVKFSPPGGRVEIRCRREGDFGAVVEVTDYGCGIVPETLSRLFRPFEQGGRQTTRRFGGLGLGLVIVKALVEQHGGTVEVKSEGEGKGATVTIRLPLVQPDAASPDDNQNDNAHAHAPNAHRLRILYVEDHTDTALLMHELLELEGHHVHTASNVAAALEAAALEGFDVLVSDLGLPDGSGLDLMRELRSRGYAIPGIVLSGYGLVHNIEESLENGFAVHLVKPVSVDELLEALAKVQ